MSLYTTIIKTVYKYLEYFQEEKDLFLLKLTRRTAKLMASLFSVLVLFLVGFLTLSILVIWLGFLLSNLLDSYALGFGIVALTAIITLALVFRYRRNILERPLQRIITELITDA